VIFSQRPGPLLAPFIRYYYQVEGSFGAIAALYPVPARSPGIIEFMFRTPFRVQRLPSDGVEQVVPIAVVGCQTHRRANLFLSGDVDAFTIVFGAGGFFSFFGVPAGELTDRDFGGEVVVGRALGELHDRLAEVRTIKDRAAVADRFLGARLADGTGPTAAISAARKIYRQNGLISVAALAAEAGLSERQFERRFQSEIGMLPKLYARVIRFEAALRLKAVRCERHWTEIAHTLGYFDQMHMVHDFQRLSGESPGAICDRLDMFVKPEVDTVGCA
jgi:AraC-like DNA-binding protein